MCWHPAKRMGGKAHEPGTLCFCKGEGKMKFSPPVEEVKALTARGEYKVAPISCEILSDICTPIEATGHGCASSYRSICRSEPSSPTNLMQQLRASGSGTDLSSASPCNDKKWAVDTMYRPPLLFSVVKNGFQGVPERYKWVPHAMLANRRSRAGYPLRGLCTADRDAVALGNVQEIRVQLFILPYQNQYFVLSKYSRSYKVLCTVEEAQKILC